MSRRLTEPRMKPNRFEALPVSAKLRRLLLATTSVGLLTAGIAIAGIQMFEQYRLLLSHVGVVADIVSQNSSAAVLFGDAAELGKVLETLKAERDIDSALVLTPDKKPLTAYNLMLENGGLPAELAVDPWFAAALTSSKAATRSGWMRLEYLAPIIFEGKTIGFIYLRMSLARLYGATLWNALIIFLVFAASTGVALLFSRRLQQRIAQPIENLAGVMERVSAEQNFSLRATPGEMDEIGRLIQGFNEMLGQIEERDTWLADYRAGLEEDIAKRTSELSHANHELRRVLEEATQARESAEQASRAKSEFLSRMSHELRTPMNAILGFSELLRLEIQDAEQRDFMEEIYRAGQHLLALIDELLELSRIETGNIAVVIQPVRVERVVKEALKLVQPLIQERHLTISREHGDCPHVSVLADATRLRQIMVNLLSNAAKYNRDHGNIHVEWRVVEGGLVRILVGDTGRGIAPDQLTHLFKPFERLGAQFTAIEGTGIGLAFSKRLAELMGGQLEAESTLGRGSAFWVDLPLSETAAEPLARPELAPPEQHGARLRILYVEDNAANLKVVDKIFQRHGSLTLISATNGEYGLELAQRYAPDLILLDIHLPGMDGYAVLKALQADKQTRHIPVIALSADAMPMEVERGLAAGFRRYLTKPIKPAELIGAIEEGLFSGKAG